MQTSQQFDFFSQDPLSELKNKLSEDALMESETQQQYFVHSEKLRSILMMGGNRQSSNGNLMNKFLNSVLSKAAQSLEGNEQCPIHRNEYLVAIDSDRKRLGCERCVFEGRHDDPKFVSLFAREIKDEFDIEYY